MGRRLTTASAIAAAAGILVSRDFTRFSVVEESMAPALLPGDYLIAKRVRRPPNRGDVVVFEHPTRAGFHLIKRVVGLPGERVDIAGGQVHVNSRPLAEPWANGPTTGEGSWQLGASEAFVLGDSRADSADDSRTLGPIALEALEWRAVLRYWPLTRAGRPASPDG